MCINRVPQVFIPELGEVFRAAPGFRLFGAQNPVQEGGGRRGLPRSFLNRFTRVAIELLEAADLLYIAGALCRDIGSNTQSPPVSDPRPAVRLCESFQRWQGTRCRQLRSVLRHHPTPHAVSLALLSSLAW